LEGYDLKGAILQNGGEFYTYLNMVFQSINEVQLQYNWLITNHQCYPNIKKHNDIFESSEEYVWLTGVQLTEIVREDDFQWIWAVLSGFPLDISLSEALKYPLPYADGYKGFWELPLSIQHPLAEIEIVPWDSSLVLVISSNDIIIDNFRKCFPLSEDLKTYNLT
jgi:hypothetical protein